MFQSINPATGEVIAEYPPHSTTEMNDILAQTDEAQKAWKATPLSERGALLKKAGRIFMNRAEQYGQLISSEMGKIKKEAEAEVKKCARICDFYAEKGPEMLADEIIEAGFTRSYARYEPMGVIFAIMPWNFPFWQAMRFIAPNLMAGNGCILKHAPNVFGTALALEEIMLEAGFPKNIFRALLVEPDQIALALENPIVKGVTLTGSERAGMAVAGKAGRELKKSVMELGGSDPFIVLADAELEQCCQVSVRSRCLNAGQVCISAKRFFVVEPLYEEFVARHQKIMENLVLGDPTDPATQMGPMAREDLMLELDAQVRQSVQEGARLVTGGARLQRKGNFYAPTLLAEVTPEMTCFQQELFGPVSSVIRVRDAQEAVRLANLSPYGLGGSVWSRDVDKALEVAHQLETGQVFINGMTTSHPALPFGGVKRSGFGRECSHHGIREFSNVKTVVVI